METTSNGAGTSYNADLPDAVPERWETAIEDFVQLLALAIDRIQDLADVVGDTMRGHPELVRGALAAAAGAVIGAFLADRVGRKPTPIIEQTESLRDRTRRSALGAAERGGALLGGAATSIRDSAEHIVRRAPSPEEIRELPRRRLPRIDSIGLPIAGRGSSGAANASAAAQLVPLLVGLAKNPIVRDLVLRAALRAAQSRGR
jgi:hypothetical protein